MCTVAPVLAPVWFDCWFVCGHGQWAGACLEVLYIFTRMIYKNAFKRSQILLQIGRILCSAIFLLAKNCVTIKIIEYVDSLHFSAIPVSMEWGNTQWA